jgi:DNA-binding MarR family transcriptional regulator
MDGTSPTDTYPPARSELDLDALMRVSRVVTAVVAGSLLATDERITFPQLRGLVLVASRRATSTTTLADALDVHPSTASRLAERLVAAGLLHRTPSSDDRRQVSLDLTHEGRTLLAAIMEHRRTAFRDLLQQLSPDDRAKLAEGLSALADVAGEPPEPLVLP